MHIEHMALWVVDLEKMKEFYCTFFKGNFTKIYRNETTGFSSYFITFSEGCRLEIMSLAELENQVERDVTCKGGFSHFAVSLGSKEEVVRLTKMIREKGFPVVSEPRMTGDGYFESVILDPEENRVELTV